MLAVYKTPAPACSPSSSPRFHHDNWNSGNYTTDAISPGHPYDASSRNGVLSITAPGAEGMCGTATRYQLVTSANPITPHSFSSAQPLGGAPAPAAPGTQQHFTLPVGAQRYVAIRAVSATGNVGLPAVIRLR